MAVTIGELETVVEPPDDERTAAPAVAAVSAWAHDRLGYELRRRAALAARVQVDDA